MSEKRKQNWSIALLVAAFYLILSFVIQAALQADEEAWHNFQRFPPLYQRVRIDTIQIEKKQPELFASRLQKLVENSRKGVMYGEWNDNGRLA